MSERTIRVFRDHKFFTEKINNTFDGKDYECMTVKDFALATNRHISQIHKFIKEGCVTGHKLRVIRLFNKKPLVLYTELFNFTFKAGSGILFHYNEKGEIILLTKVHNA